MAEAFRRRSDSIPHPWTRPRIRPAGCSATWRCTSSRARSSETLGAPVGVVDAIAGQSRVWAEFRGRSGHAGTMPMEGRLDALGRGGGARPGGRAARPIGRGPAHDSRCDRGRAGGGQRVAGHGAVQHRRPPRAQRHPDDGVDGTANAGFRLADRRGVAFRVVREEHHAAVPADSLLSDWLTEAVASTGHTRTA